MKTLKLITIGILFLSAASQAQVSVNININPRPDWAPAAPEAVTYYYLPDVDSYYDVRGAQFVYYGNGRWIRSGSLPYRYRNYDLYHGRTVVLTDYHGTTPYVLHKVHRAKYCGPQQTVIVKKYKKHGNGHGHGHGKH